MSSFYETHSDGTASVRVKAVPGASRDGIAGAIGDRLKIRVSAPPEGGKANKAIVRVLAEALGVRAADVTLESGSSNPVKVLRVRGADEDALRGLVK